LDESWLCRDADHESIWRQSNEKGPRRQDITVERKYRELAFFGISHDSKKQTLSQGMGTFNSIHYHSKILEALSERWGEQAAAASEILIVHADGASLRIPVISPKSMSRNRTTRATHPIH
jgi:hypothetical protein